MKRIDITGKRFDRLTALEIDHYDKYPSGERYEAWLCECDCGKTTIVAKKNLLGHITRSCGCLQAERRQEAHRTHGDKHAKLYAVWSCMKERCNNPNNKNYNDYGGRGIKVCDEWNNDYSLFKEWAYCNGFCEGLSIDRIDVNKGYSPDNCRWVDYTTQANNRRNSIYLSYNGETKTLSEWARSTGLNYDTINNRYHSGMSPEDILSKKKHKTGTKKKLNQ